MAKRKNIKASITVLAGKNTKVSVRKLKANLVAASAPTSAPARVGVTFFSGVGQITASLFRNGVLINMQSISSSGNINFSEVQSGDVISINGVCTGAADIAINRTTTPTTPEHFTAGIILSGYLIN